MNERIRELALQARLGPALLLHHYGKVDALTDTEQEGLEQIEKFAELIVKECVSISNIERDNSVGCGYVTQTIGQRIRKHFGVEK